MKASKFLVSVVLSGTMLVSSVFAAEGNKPVKAPLSPSDLVRNQIVNALSDVSATNQEVVIRFSVTEKKGFEVLKVEGKDAEIVEAVEAELASKLINVPSEMAGVYSLKVRFSDTEVSGTVDPANELRNEIASVLSDAVVSGSGSVKVAFSVVNNNVKIKNVEGTNKALVSDVKLALAKKPIVSPAELAGNFSVVVKF